MDSLHQARHVFLWVLIVAAAAVNATAEPCVLAYPTADVVFRYDPARYQVKGPADSLFDPAYSIGGEMLWDRVEQRIAFEVYQAPGVTGFEVSPTRENEFFFLGTEMTLVVDGFSRFPRQLAAIHLLFSPTPPGVGDIRVDGTPVSDLRHVIPHLNVASPTGTGFFSDTTSVRISCSGIARLEISVFADRNGNRIFDGDACYRIIMENFTIPVEERTWGAIKAVFEER